MGAREASPVSGLSDRIKRSEREEQPRRRGAGAARQVGEPRTPVILALAVAIALPFGLPPDLRHWTIWVMTAFEVVLCAAMVILDPGRIDGRSVLIRRVRIALITVLVVRASTATVVLVVALVTADKSVSTSSELFRAG